MGVYIKGMKKPEKCLACPMLNYEDWCVLQEWTPEKDYTNYTWEDMRKNCPLVEVEEPHGRLIDADKIVKDLRHDVTVDQDMLDYEALTDVVRETTQFDKDCKQNAVEIIESTSTVIEGSE